MMKKLPALRYSESFLVFHHLYIYIYVILGVFPIQKVQPTPQNRSFSSDFGDFSSGVFGNSQKKPKAFLSVSTLHETNISPTDQWLEDEFPFGAKGLFSEGFCC